jgi:hypothetical protein
MTVDLRLFLIMNVDHLPLFDAWAGTQFMKF